MGELLNGIFECLDINKQYRFSYRRQFAEHDLLFKDYFYTQVHEKIGIDAVYFLRD